MKKVVIVLSFLVCGLSNAHEVTYSLNEMAVKIIKSSALSPSGKVFLMGYFEDLEPIEIEASTLSEMLCEQATLEGIDLFLSNKNCEVNLIHFLSLMDKGGEISASGNVTNGPDGKPVYSANFGIKWTW